MSLLLIGVQFHSSNFIRLFVGWRGQSQEITKEFFYNVAATIDSFFKVFSFRSCRSQMFFKKGVLKNFANFTGKHLCCSLFLIKFQASGLQRFKKKLQHRSFPVKFAKFLRAPIFTKHLRWLLLFFDLRNSHFLRTSQSGFLTCILLWP